MRPNRVFPLSSCPFLGVGYFLRGRESRFFWFLFLFYFVSYFFLCFCFILFVSFLGCVRLGSFAEREESAPLSCEVRQSFFT